MLNYASRYRAAMQHLRAKHSEDEAMSLLVGGSFDAIGAIERDIVIGAGLRTGQTLIDVGCGSGRLAKALRDQDVQYLGTDVVPDALAYARRMCGRSDWRFEVVDRISIPAPDASADVVCFFSVWTHLLHEDSYLYLLEAHRVLKTGGHVIASFLEFRNQSLWPAFLTAVDRTSDVHVQFCDRDAIQSWSDHAGFRIKRFHDSAPGAPVLGQSWCVLEKLGR